ncbi:MAG: hypothetical protein KME40_32645 [Komarekiella atlantica HA4396-MV6]|nr:hypothetical protein [Komarekiella atlantica HA4396-MV6]
MSGEWGLGTCTEFAQLLRSRKACGMATLRAQPQSREVAEPICTERSRKACGIATLRAQPQSREVLGKGKLFYSRQFLISMLENFSRQRKVLRREVAIAQRKACGMATLRASLAYGTLCERASEGFPPSKLRLGFPSLTRR